eukprot:320635_1
MNINEFDKDEKKTESENQNDEDIKKENEKRKLISALISFDTVIKQISNIDEESSKSLTELTAEWKENIKLKYEITKKDIDNVRKSRKDIEDMEKRITKLQDEITELKDKKHKKGGELLQYLKDNGKNMETGIKELQDEINKLKLDDFKNLKDTDGKLLYSKFDQKGLPTHDSKGKEISESDIKKLSEQQLTNINDEIDKLTVKKRIVEYASETTASIGPILTLRLVKFVDTEKIKTVEEFQNAVKNEEWKGIKGIGKQKAIVLGNIKIDLT